MILLWSEQLGKKTVSIKIIANKTTCGLMQSPSLETPTKQCPWISTRPCCRTTHLWMMCIVKPVTMIQVIAWLANVRLRHLSWLSIHPHELTCHGWEMSCCGLKKAKCRWKWHAGHDNDVWNSKLELKPQIFEIIWYRFVLDYTRMYQSWCTVP